MTLCRFVEHQYYSNFLKFIPAWVVWVDSLVTGYQVEDGWGLDLECNEEFEITSR